MATSIGLKPLGDRVVVLPTTLKEEVSASGIVISSVDTKEKPAQGTVVAIGSGRVEEGKTIPVAVALGDTVLFSKYGYEEVTVNGIEYFIIQESNILAIIK